MPKINQLNQVSRLSNTDLVAIETPDGSNTRSIEYKYLRSQLQNESKSVFALHGETASDDQVAEAVAEWLDEYISTPEYPLDKTLTVENAAADSKAAGNLIIVNSSSGSTTKLNITTTDDDVTIAEMSDVTNLAMYNAENYIPRTLTATNIQNGITWAYLGDGLISYTGSLENPDQGSQFRYYYDVAQLPDWAEIGKTYYVKVQTSNPKLCLSPIFYGSDGNQLPNGGRLMFYEDGTFAIPSGTVGMQIRALMMPNATVSGTECIRCAILSADSNASLTSKVEELSEKAPRLYDYNAYNYIGNALNKTGKSSTGTMTFTDLGNGLVSYIGDTEANTQFLFYSDAQNLPEWAEREKTYYIKAKTDNLSVTFSIYCYDSNGSILSGSAQLYSNDGTYTIPADAVGMAIRIYAPAGTNVTELSYIKVAILNADSNENLSKQIENNNTDVASLRQHVDREIDKCATKIQLNGVSASVGSVNARVDVTNSHVSQLNSMLTSLNSRVNRYNDYLQEYYITKSEVARDYATKVALNAAEDYLREETDLKILNETTYACNRVYSDVQHDIMPIRMSVNDIDNRLPSAANKPNGTYVLKAIVSNGSVSYGWVKES